MTTRGVLVRVVGVCVAALVCGCAAERTLPAVRASGDRAYEKGDYVRAEADYREAVTREPGDWRTRQNLGKTLMILDRPREAREHLAVALNVRPDDSETIELLAQAMLESGDKDGMFRLLRSRAEERRTVEDYQRFGRFASKAGDNDEAERAFLTAARFDGGKSFELQRQLGDFYQSIGAEEKALTRYRMALYLKPEDRETADRIRALGKVPGPSYVLRPEEQEQRQ